MTFDTLTYNGTERTLAAWGFALDSVHSEIGNFKEDVWSGAIPSVNITADPVFPYFAAVIIRINRVSAGGADNSFSGGTVEFQGRRVMNTLQAQGRRQGGIYQFQGPYYDLDITQYLQTFKGHTTNYHPGEVVLNTAAAPQISTAGLRFISVGDQLQGILQFVIDSYIAQGLPAPFQYVGRDLLAGAINLDVSGPGSGAVNENTDETGAPYNKLVNAGTTIDKALFKFFLKSEILRPMSAAQFIQKLMDSTPRTNIGFDYSTVPPTVRAVNLDGAPAVSLPLFNGIDHQSIEIQKRDDLVPSAVIIGYRFTDTVGGNSVVDYQEDKWGPHGANSGLDPSTGPGVLIQILDLQGFSETFSTGKLDCEPLACIGGTHAQKRAWWASKRGADLAKLESYRVRFQEPDAGDDETVFATTIPDAKIFYASAGFDSTGVAVAKDQEFTAADYAFFTRRLVRGTHHAWMQVDGVFVQSVKVKISATMAFAEYDCLGSGGTPELDKTGNILRQNNSSDQHANLELTNGVTGPYSTIASSTPGESYIIGAGGIAQYLFNMLSTIQYEGEYVKVEASFSGGVSLFNRLNLTGGRAEWAAMKAQIQSIKKDWGRKTTTVQIGVSKHLNAGQLSAFLNMWRLRRAWYNPLLKADNTQASGGEVEMPVTAAQANTVEGLENEGQKTNTFYTTPPAGVTPGVIAAQLNHEPKIIKTILDASTPVPSGSFTAEDLKVMQPRELGLCDESGDKVYAIVHMGGTYEKT